MTYTARNSEREKDQCIYKNLGGFHESSAEKKSKISRKPAPGTLVFRWLLWYNVDTLCRAGVRKADNPVGTDQQRLSRGLLAIGMD